MSRYHREWTDRFSDYLEGELDEAERLRIETHLAGCGACRDVLSELHEVVERADALAPLTPPRDLWPGITAAVGGTVGAVARPGEPSVIELPSARRPPPPSGWAGRARVGLRRTVLVGAAAGLVAVSAATTWWVAGNVRTGAEGVPRAAVDAAADVLREADARAGGPPAELASELATLEGVLAAARDALDPNTVRVLERNLGVIERAIADSREALALDPGNDFLAEHLERMYRRKLLYLEDAVRVAQWTS